MKWTQVIKKFESWKIKDYWKLLIIMGVTHDYKVKQTNFNEIQFTMFKEYCICISNFYCFLKMEYCYVCPYESCLIIIYNLKKILKPKPSYILN